MSWLVTYARCLQAAAYEVRIRQLEQHMARSVSGRSGPYFSGTTSRDIGSASGFVSGITLQDWLVCAFCVDSSRRL